MTCGGLHPPLAQQGPGGDTKLMCRFGNRCVLLWALNVNILSVSCVPYLINLDTGALRGRTANLSILERPPQIHHYRCADSTNNALDGLLAPTVIQRQYLLLPPLIHHCLRHLNWMVVSVLFAADFMDKEYEVAPKECHAYSDMMTLVVTMKMEVVVMKRCVNGI